MFLWGKIFTRIQEMHIIKYSCLGIKTFSNSTKTTLIVLNVDMSSLQTPSDLFLLCLLFLGHHSINILRHLLSSHLAKYSACLHFCCTIMSTSLIFICSLIHVNLYLLQFITLYIDHRVKIFSSD